MARPLRIDFNGAWHHVMNRGRRREAIFRDSQDYKAFIGLLKQATQAKGVKSSFDETP